ncbi:M16 family metallopeptidase [Dyadobacter fanqingshengii]|uniref:Insulinase family protein n=1 Tax=Dyadobacter fanqingshengii TaxID=2906443 RepID=A0A9X1PEM2_9BACT|nr:pitrilysin family protein [Dyadobacter fanqingshengii]MCF0043090.1 insulinase family protein [Dyadobacter fanqingshengii]USJ35643.1 insulinase family protein [Dyadobacter fanqingshengii]
MVMNFKRRNAFRGNAVIGLLLTSLIAAPSFSQELPKGVKKVTSVEGITEYNLENGLKVLMFPDPSKPTITVNVTYLVGSRHEGYGETGMAHLLEHLVFKGTPKHPNIPQELTEHGARPNGTTWYDRTNYFETFSATEENLKWALDLESDRMVNSFIAKKDLDSEFSVVRNEFESGENSPFRVLMERVISGAFLWHNYGKSTIGNRSDIERVPIDNLQAFYKKHYQPDNAVLTVAGKIDEAKTLAMINDYFGKIAKPTRVLPKSYTSEPTQDGERFVELRRTGDVQMLMAAYHIMPGSHADYPAMEVLTELLTAEPNGRLYKNLVNTKKASSEFGFSFQLFDPGFVLFGAEVLKENSLDEAKKAFTATLDSAAVLKPSKEDIERAKTTILKNWDLEFRNSERVGLSISEAIATGDWRLAFLFRDNIRKVSPEDVFRVAQYYFRPSNRTLGTFVPEANPVRAEIPEAPNVADLVKDYKGEAVVAEGEAFDPSPMNVETRTTRVEKPNAIETALLPKTTRGNVVAAKITLRYGDEKSLTNKATISDLTGSMLDRGSKTKTRQQLKDEFDKLKARVSFFGINNQAGANIETTKENLPAVMKLVAEVLKNPAFDETEFEKLKQEELAGIESQRSEPQAIAFNQYRRIVTPYPKGDIRYVATFDEDVESIKATTIDQIKQFHKDFYGANNASATVVGDFDKAALQKIINDEFGNWKSAKPFTRIASPYVAVKSESKMVETPDKANAMFIAGLNMPLQDTDPDYPALVIGNYLLGGGFLNSRLATRIRQKEGLSYGVGSQFSASSLDKNGTFMSYAIYAPQNAEKLEAAFKEEIEKTMKEGFTAEELKAAKSGYLQSRQVGRSQDASLANTLTNNLYLNRTMQWDADFEKKIEALTPEQIKAAFNKHIDYNKLVIIKAGDFAKAKKGAPTTAAPAPLGGSEKK